MIRFAVKLGVATATIYYINEQGIWRSSHEAEQVLKKYKETVKPYVQDVTAQIPIELPELPERNTLSTLAKESWNQGVLTSFKFISELPSTINQWTTKGISIAMENQELRKFIDSFKRKSENLEKK